MRKKTILFVAMPNSVHTARWLAQLSSEDWNIHLFPSTVIATLHPKMVNLTVHHLFHHRKVSANDKPLSVLVRFIVRAEYALLRRLLIFLPWWRAKQLAKVIARVQPDIVHSLEFQHSAYLTLAAKQYYQGQFPTWMVTNWGSDIFFFGQFKEHQAKIQQVLAECDYYACECLRDVQLAKEFGFEKTVLPVFPNTGGFDLAKLVNIRQTNTSERKFIMLKGYQGWAGRALMALDALALCKDVLQAYTVLIYSADVVVVKAAKCWSEQTGIVSQIIPHDTTHDEILVCHAKARVSIGLSISDAISTSLLEAMVMGSFPIQSCTACADEWIEHGVSGAIVPPEEPEVVAMWIRKALTDDAWVNRAAELNWQTALARLDGEMLAKQAVAMYSMEQS